MLTAVHVCAAELNLNRDANGWTQFATSADSRICYIAADGNDSTATYYSPSDPVIGVNPQSPVGTVSAYASFAAAYAATRSGFPDWILFKRGDTFSISSGLGTIARNGRGLSEPFVISAYGQTGSSPVLNTGISTGLGLMHGTQYLAINGLDFYAQGRNVSDGGAYSTGGPGVNAYVGLGQNPITAVLIEGCKFRYYTYGALVQGTPDNPHQIDIVFRRNVFSDNYGYGSNDSQGIYATLLGQLTMDQNYFIHNGWLMASGSSGTDRSNGQATIWNHGIYLASINNLIINENVIIDPSASNIKLTRQYQTNSTTVSNNLTVGGSDGVQAGNNYTATEYDYHFSNFTVINNVITRTGRGNNLNLNAANGLKLGALDTGNISNNLLINSDSSATTSQALSADYSKSRNVTWDSNVAYNFGRTQGFLISVSGSSNINVTNNIIQNPAYTYSTGVVRLFYDIRGEFNFLNNTYYALNQEFFVTGSSINLAAWNAWSGDTGSWVAPSFTASTRDVDTYMGSIGDTATIDAFIDKIRAQDRYDWNTDYTADAVNDYIRTGFDMSEYSSSGGTGNPIRAGSMILRAGATPLR